MDNELNHWGIKGMKWGIRRFQKKDGSLTPAGKKRYGDDDSDEETRNAERRARALKSSNAEEIFENRDVLTTAEIRERLDRINVERQLAAVAASTKKTGMDRAKEVVDKVNDIYKMANSPAAVAARKALTGVLKKAPVPKKLKDVYDNMDKVISELSDAELKQLSDRANSERNFKQTLKELYKKDPARRSLKEIYEDRDNVSDKELKDAFARATTEKNIKKILDDAEPKPKSEETTNGSSDAEYSTDGINWHKTTVSEASSVYKASVDDGKAFVTNSSTTWDASPRSADTKELSMTGWDFVQKTFYDPPDEYLK